MVWKSFLILSCENDYQFGHPSVQRKRKGSLFLCGVFLTFIKDFCPSISFWCWACHIRQDDATYLRGNAFHASAGNKLVRPTSNWVILSHGGLRNTKWAFLVFSTFSHASLSIFHMRSAVGSGISPMHFPWSLVYFFSWRSSSFWCLPC